MTHGVRYRNCKELEIAVFFANNTHRAEYGKHSRCGGAAAAANWSRYGFLCGRIGIHDDIWSWCGGSGPNSLVSGLGRAREGSTSHFKAPKSGLPMKEAMTAIVVLEALE